MKRIYKEEDLDQDLIIDTKMKKLREIIVEMIVEKIEEIMIRERIKEKGIIRESMMIEEIIIVKETMIGTGNLLTKDKADQCPNHLHHHSSLIEVY